MARQAHAAGADAVKYQHHLPREEMLEDVPMSDNFDEPLFEFLEKHTLKIDDHAELLSLCCNLGIVYMCTPFSYRAAVELAEIGVESFKIGSGELSGASVARTDRRARRTRWSCRPEWRHWTRSRIRSPRCAPPASTSR